MSMIEGELQMNDQGQLLISGNLILAGTIIEVLLYEGWTSICIEEIHGTSYLLPYIDLKPGLKARMEDCHADTTFCPMDRI